MRQALPQLWVFFLLAALVFPAIGPVMDHHFAERQPAHRHAGPAGYHVHAHAYQQAHAHTPDARANAEGQAIVLYNHDSAPSATASVIVDDMALQTFLLFEPTSLFALPPSAHASMKPGYTPPPEQPHEAFV